MPTYDYKCDACGQKWEKFQSIKADPIKTCPYCGQESARRLIGTGAGLIFKGSGFYITDYREKGYAEQAKADSGGTKSDAKVDGQSDKASSSEPAKPAADVKPAAAGEAAPTPSPAATPSPAPATKSES